MAIAPAQRRHSRIRRLSSIPPPSPNDELTCRRGRSELRTWESLNAPPVRCSIRFDPLLSSGTTVLPDPDAPDVVRRASRPPGLPALLAHPAGVEDVDAAQAGK